MSFLAELQQLPAMAALSGDARRRFVLAYVTSTGERKLRLCLMRRYEDAPNEGGLR